MPAPSWPALPVAQWQSTRDTLHLWAQIVGKVRLAHEPLARHWWNVPLYVTAHGLTTSLISCSAGRSFQIDFDFRHDRLNIVTAAGAVREMLLAPRSVANFYAEVMRNLDELGIHTQIWPMPVEIDDAIPFPDDDEHASYDHEQALRFWLALVEIEHTFKIFQTPFLGKVSPVHLFWGGLDLAVTRFSGRPAPPHRGHAAHCRAEVMLEAYSQEVSSAGYWPGGDSQGIFYSYAYPEPEGFQEFPIRPAAATYSLDLGEFVLPYEAVQAAKDPEQMLLDFLQSTYAAAATCGNWNRQTLERYL